MNEKQLHLWRSLQAFQIDEPGAEYPFSVRLAKENNWSMAFTEQAIEEYKRFMFLAVEAGHMVSPSETIDKVWHLHLIYTRSYWIELCEKILNQRIEHIPSKGGRSEKENFTNLQEKTKESYKHFFGSYPPPEIWEEELMPVKNAAIQPWQKNVESYSFPVIVAAAGILTMVFFLLSMTVLTAIPGKTFLALFLVLNGAGFLIAKALNGYFTKEVTEDREYLAHIRKLSACEVAYMRSNDDRHITNAVLAKLAGSNQIAFNPTKKTLTLTGSPDNQNSPLENAVLAIIADNNDLLLPASLHQKIRKHPTFSQIPVFIDSLKSQMSTWSDLFNAKWMPLLTMTAILSFGLARMTAGILNQKPVLFLALLCFGSAYLVYWWMKNWDKALYQKYIPEYFKGLYGSPDSLTNSHREDWAVGLYGTGVYSHSFFPMFIPIYSPGHYSGGGDYSGGSSCSSGDSGSDSGSGCGGGDGGGGGCGGCGGGD